MVSAAGEICLRKPMNGLRTGGQAMATARCFFMQERPAGCRVLECRTYPAVKGGINQEPEANYLIRLKKRWIAFESHPARLLGDTQHCGHRLIHDQRPNFFWRGDVVFDHIFVD